MCALLAADPTTEHFVGKPSVFLSHAWLFKILNVADALLAFVELQPEGAPEGFFWFDCFALDEHATFKEAIREIPAAAGTRRRTGPSTGSQPFISSNIVSLSARFVLVRLVIVWIEQRLCLDLRAEPLVKRSVEDDGRLRHVHFHGTLLVDDAVGGVFAVGLVEIIQNSSFLMQNSSF